MQINGWGRYPKIESDILRPLSVTQCADELSNAGSVIARGLGRSYGDSSLAENVISTRFLDHYLAFDDAKGILTCSSGVSLHDILHNFAPRGWFLPATPGTRFVTVGGAIASDVHGKNHHIEGSFCDHVTNMELLLGNGEKVIVSPTENPDLFHATCGGMGLTGIILSATFCMKPIRSSQIIETTIKASDLDAVLASFEEHAKATYSVAWIDCLARGRQLGRSLLMLGEHATEGTLFVRPNKQLPVPCDMPNGLLNYSTIKLFNMLYYAKASNMRQVRHIPFESFFYPLDALANWNRLYGKSGFVQYQFVLPRASGITGLRTILEQIAASGRGSFLAVLKVFGKGNDNLLSFPTEGYSLALDFKAEPDVLRLLDDLDKLVLDYGGRIYLTKDARMSETTFKSCYPRWQEFEDIRGHFHATGKFASLQSRRLGLQ